MLKIEIFTLFLILFYLECIHSIHVNFDVNPPEYGVDCSYPIHRDIDRKACPQWANFYDSLMEGCYKYYSKQECDNDEDNRIRMNNEQPKTQHNYTTVGFKKIRAPKEAWEPLINFYNENKANAKVEKWYRGSTIVNIWDSPTHMVSFENPQFRGGWTVKQQIWDGVKPIIEEWIGGHKIEPTSLYGIRLYTGGSILAPHVDRLPLISSCIINVDHDLDEPWPLEVYDHAGRAYNVTMNPGDLVLYESSTILHGRPFPMKGRYFANIFVHFKPVDHDKFNELDKAARDLENGEEPLTIRRRHMPQRSLRNSPSVDKVKPGTLTSSNAEMGELFRLAASEGNLELVQTMLAKDPTLMYSADENYWQALHEAIRGGKINIVKYLVSQGADLKWKVAGGGNAAWLARTTLKADNPIVTYLQSIGATEDF